MALRLHLSGCDDPKTDVCELIARWLDDEENGPWLLIVDNADSADVMLGLTSSSEGCIDTETTTKPVIDYLPRVVDRSRRLLITTRNKDVADSLTESASPTHVGPFSLAEARLLLCRKITREEDRPDEKIMEELLRSLAYVPLAITQAVAYANRNGITIAQYLTMFQASNSERMTQLSTELQDYRREPGFPNSVFRTCRLSFDQMRQRDPAAAKLLAFLAFLDGQSIPLTLLARTQALEADWRQALGTVVGYSLVMAVDETVSIHSLVQESVRYWLDLQKEKESCVEQVIQLLAVSFPSGDHSNWTVCQNLLPHAEVALRHLAGLGLNGCGSGDLRYNVSWFQWASGQYEAAFRHVRESYDIQVAILGDENQKSINSLSLMALVLRDQGKYEQAEEMNRRALAGKEKVLGVDHPDTLKSVSNLALVLRDQGKYEQAEETNRRALAGKEKVLGVDHPNILTTVSNLAVVLQDQGKYEQAEEMNRRALAGKEKVLGVDHPSTLMSVYCLADLLDAKQDRSGALKLYDRAFEGFTKVLGLTHPTTMACQQHKVSLVEKIGLLR